MKRLLKHLTLIEWGSLDLVERYESISGLCDLVHDEFELVPLSAKRPDENIAALPEFRHRATQSDWIFIPGGEYWMGLGVAEQEAANRICSPPPLSVHEMRPVHWVQVMPFLIMKYPVTLEQATTFLTIPDLESRPSFDGPPNKRPVLLNREEAEALSLAFGSVLPSEAQWECVQGWDELSLFLWRPAS